MDRAYIVIVDGCAHWHLSVEPAHQTNSRIDDPSQMEIPFSSLVSALVESVVGVTEPPQLVLE